MPRIQLGLALGFTLATASVPAFAGPELIVNGNFEQTTATSSQQVTNSNLTGWTINPTPGYQFIYLPDSGTSGTSADTTGGSGMAGTVKLWGPGTGVNNGLTTSPAGKNFVAMDNNYYQAALQQTVNNLIVGAQYTLKFYWAAAQQAGFYGATQEQITVTFGNKSAATEVVNLPEKGFSGWKLVTFYFTATSTSQTLSFLATGTPGGQPPFSLLDGVSLQVPEPGTWTVLGAGLLGLFAFTWLRRRGGGGSAA